MSELPGVHLIRGLLEFFVDPLSLRVDVEIVSLDNVARFIVLHVRFIGRALKGLHLRLSQR